MNENDYLFSDELLDDAEFIRASESEHRLTIVIGERRIVYVRLLNGWDTVLDIQIDELNYAYRRKVTDYGFTKVMNFWTKACDIASRQMQDIHESALQKNAAWLHTLATTHEDKASATA